MVRKIILDKMSICIPQEKQKLRLVERLIKLGEKRDRSVNYLVVKAVLEYLDRERVRICSTLGQLYEKAPCTSEGQAICEAEYFAEAKRYAVAYRRERLCQLEAQARYSKYGSATYAEDPNGPVLMYD